MEASPFGKWKSQKLGLLSSEDFNMSMLIDIRYMWKFGNKISCKRRLEGKAI